MAPSLNARDVETLLDSRSWHERKTISVLLGEDAAHATALGYTFGPDFAFLAVAVSQRRRSFVFLKQAAALVTFDLAPTGSAAYSLEGFRDLAVRGNSVTGALPSGRWFVEASILLSGREDATEFLCAMQFSDSKARPAAATEFIGSVDLAGTRIGEWVVLFHNEARSAREPQFFFAERQGPIKCLVTGLAPGAWELWHNGFVKEPSLEVSPRAGALYFEGPPGNYFFRRYS